MTRPADSPRADSFRGSPTTDLLLALGLALILRATMLAAWPLWGDEAATAVFAGLSWSDLYGPLARVEPTPPTYYALMKLWTGLAGDSVAALRWPSVVLGVAAIVPLHAFCLRAFGRQAARRAALLLAVASWHVVHGQEARVYPLLFLVFCLGLVTAQRLLAAADTREAPRWAWGIALGVIAGGMMWLHNTGAFAAAALFTYAAAVLLAERRLTWATIPPFLAAGAVAAAVATPCLLTALRIVGDADNGLAFLPRPDPLTAIGVFSNLLPIRAAALQLPGLIPDLAYQLVQPLASILSSSVLMIAIWATRALPQAIGLMAALAASFLLFVVVGLVVPVLIERTILYTTALSIPLIAAGTALLARQRLGQLIFGAVLLAELIGAVATYHTPKLGEDWGAVARRVAAVAEPGERVFALGVFPAAALGRSLADAGAPRAIAPLLPIGHGEQIQRITWTARTGAAPRRADLSVAELCAELGPGRPVALVWLEQPFQVGFRDAFAATLRAAGARPVSAETIVKGMRLERWTAPDCARAAPPD